MKPTHQNVREQVNQNSAAHNNEAGKPPGIQRKLPAYARVKQVSKHIYTTIQNVGK